MESWAHIVLDEAYPNTRQELSPYRGRNLDIWNDSFNYHLSLHRQCVERAFGILAERWGVFWRPLRVAYRRIPLLIRVDCKLHNYCIDKFGMTSSIEIARSKLISMKMCASTHDSTAYLVSDLSNAIRSGRLESWAHIVLDEG